VTSGDLIREPGDLPSNSDSAAGRGASVSGLTAVSAAVVTFRTAGSPRDIKAPHDGLARARSLAGNDRGQVVPQEQLPRLHVCVTCKNAELAEPGEGEPAHGKLLLERIAAILDASDTPPITVEPIICMGNCERGCTIAISAPGKWSYMLGGLTPDHAEDLVTYGEAFRNSKNGTVFRSKRPQSLFDAIIARFPALLDISDTEKA